MKCIWVLVENQRPWVRRASRSRWREAARVQSTDRASEACESDFPHTGQLHGPCKREVGSTWVSSTDRVREIGLARVFNTGRVREACNFHFPHTGRADQHGPCWLFGLHGSRLVLHGAWLWFLILHGACSWLSTGHAFWHGSLILHGSLSVLHGSSFFYTGRVIFLLLR